MEFFDKCEDYESLIKNFHLTKKDYLKMASFLATIDSQDFNSPTLIEKWAKFNKMNTKKVSLLNNSTPSFLFRATFGANYTIEELAKNPLHYSKGSNGTGLYTVENNFLGINYIKRHLSKNFKPFSNESQGNILKIPVDESAKIMSKMSIVFLQRRLILEIENSELDRESKNIFQIFLSKDISILSILLGADILYIPNGHLLILNKDILNFPKKDLSKYSLLIDLTKFRNKDKHEHEKVDKFLAQ